MNFAELKELLGEEGKVVVVENNEPVLVALTYEQYKKEKDQRDQSKPVQQPQAKAVSEAPAPQQAPSASPGELTIDDLPL